MPRVTVYNDKVRARLVEMIRASACARGGLRAPVEAAGVNWHTFCAWQAAGNRALDGIEKGADPRYADLAADVREAVAKNRVEIRAAMRAEAQGNPGPDGKPTGPRDMQTARYLDESMDKCQLFNAELRRKRAEASIAEQKAAGTYTEHAAHTLEVTNRVQVVARIDALLDKALAAHELTSGAREAGEESEE